MLSNSAIDPAALGANIAHARKKLGLTQDALARQLGITRQTLITFESGQRMPADNQLKAIADAVGSSLRDLLSLGSPDEAVSVRFRALRGAGEYKSALDTLEDYGRRYVFLEELANDRSVRREPPILRLDRVSNIERSADQLATSERLRLGLGDGPLPELRKVLEEDVGLRIFGLTELQKTKVSGLFVYSRQYGALIGFNTGHDARRVRWTLCHEYCHYLTERFEPEITRDDQIGRRDKREQFADAFAARFLMPATGLSRRFTDMLEDANGTMTVAHLVMLSQFFEVSFQALVQRLEELECITKGTYAMLKERGFKPREAEGILGLESRSAFERLPFRYTFLVATQYWQGKLSEGDVAVFMHTDRLSAREIIQKIPELGSDNDLNLRIGVPR
ncbi:MAG TPA: XRE family transcriptional regulator [Candidatus Baltobacteraceae bacterium]|nr:XRE family transcriptional regulator [Candidatus Baltobacteraceae bacterium]